MDDNETAVIVSLDGAMARKMLRDLRNRPFLAIVINEDETVTFYDKSIGTEQVSIIREAIEGKLSERMDADGSKKQDTPDK